MKNSLIVFLIMVMPFVIMTGWELIRWIQDKESEAWFSGIKQIFWGILLILSILIYGGIFWW